MMNTHSVKKISRALLCSLLFLAFAPEVKASPQDPVQDPLISITQSKASLQSILEEIEKQTGFVFFYNNRRVDVQKQVSVRANKEKLSKVLPEILTNNNILYKIVGKQIVLYAREADAEGAIKDAQQQFTATQANKAPIAEPSGSGSTALQGKQEITGTVVSEEDGKPVEYVTVMIKGTSNYGITDAKGHYSLLSDKSDGTLVFSLIGYDTREEAIEGRKIVNTTLSSQIFTLENVVVTGYQTLSKERSAGAFAKVTSKEIESRLGTNNLMQRMEGLAPGLVVNNSVGADQYLVRGATSVNSNRSPLYVLDGVPIELTAMNNMLNPNDVESVTILRDATAASIWGAQAANGVIVITTKKGVKANKVSIRYNGYYTYEGKPRLDCNNQMNSKDFIAFTQEVFDPVAYPWSSVTTLSATSEPYVLRHEQILYDLDNGVITKDEADKRLNALASVNNRSQLEKYYLQPSFLNSHALTLTGGTDAYRFYGSLAYSGNQAYSKDNKSDSYLINFRQDIKPFKWLQFDLTTNVSYKTSNNQPQMYGNKQGLNNYLPYELFADENGNPLSQAHLYRYEPYRLQKEAEAQLNFDYVPLEEMNLNTSNSTSFYGRVNLGLTVNFTKALRLEGRYQYQKGYQINQSWNDPRSYRVRNELGQFTVKAASPTGKPTYYLPTTGGYFEEMDTNMSDWTVRHQLAYDGNWNERLHQLTAMIGLETRDKSMETTPYFQRGYDMQTLVVQPVDEKTLASVGINNPVLPQLGRTTNLLSTPSRKKSESTYRYFSLYANAGYTLMKKYTLNGSLRIDQSNLFGTDPSVRWRPIWSVGGAWNIKAENFMKDHSVIDRLNLRISYGLGGTPPAPGYGGPEDIIQASSIPTMLMPQYYIITPGNKALIWEQTATTNIGIDIALFNRIMASLDVYNKSTSDLLSYQPVDPTSGWFAAYNNVGSLYNRGFELSLNTSNIQKKEFSWKSVLTLSYNKSKVTELKSEMAVDPYAKTTIGFIEGYPTYSLFAYRWAGLDKNGNPTVYNAAGEAVSKDMKDLDALDHVGVTQPVWTSGFTNIFTYKNLTLSCLIIFSLGNKMFDDSNVQFFGRVNTNMSNELLDRWQQSGDESKTNVPKYIPSNTLSTSERNIDYYNRSTIRVLDASFIKMRDISLSYDFPKLWTNKIGLESIVVKGQITNPFAWFANGKGIDPEYYNPTYGYRGTKMGPAYTIGVDISF